MYSIKMYGVKAEDRPFAERWAQKHQVKLAMTPMSSMNAPLMTPAGLMGLPLYR